LFGPEDPGGEDTVEEGLDEGGVKEMLTFLALELKAESFFQSFADGCEGGKIVGTNTGKRCASIRSKEPGKVLGCG